VSRDHTTALGRVRARAVSVVWNRAERRPRLPVRLVLTAVVAAVLAGLLAVGLRLLAAVGSLPSFEADSPVLRAVGSLVAAVLVVAVVAVAGIAVDRRRLADFGFHLDRDWWVDCAFGAALGVALMGGILLVGVAAGWFRVTGYAVTTGGPFAVLVVAYLVLFVAVSVSEELAVRGYLLTNLAEGLRVGPLTGRVALGLGVLLTSGLFGLLHAGNPNATLASTATIGLAGVLLAAGYALTGELAIPLGLHFSWNFAQGVLFGFPVSGLRLGVAVIETREAGPDLVTGGRFGPEAGLLGIAAILVGIATIAWWVRARTDRLRLDPAVWTPELRWDDAGAE
jgi:membrane protease YdiL (CAAX protease family)